MDRNKYVVQCRKTLGVALRKESVDRNLAVWAVDHAYQLSLSARRAWIEIKIEKNIYRAKSSRSPQGERG